MKKNLLLFILACFAMASTAWGQVEELSEKDTIAVQRILEIREIWADNPIQVENDFPNARIRNFAKAFAGNYLQYRPNVAMMDYLKKPGEYDWSKRNYYVEDDPRNGFIKCDIIGQFDYKTELCYWRRPNGHLLVGVLLQTTNEGERSTAVLMFYDFDSETQLMTPDKKVYQTVTNLMAKHQGNAYFHLPQEGKDIIVTTAYWSETDDDFVYDDFLLKWKDNSFVEGKIVE